MYADVRNIDDSSHSSRYYPIDVTEVLQYVTLYQCFLAARRGVVNQELHVSARDSMLLAALSLQATKGDYDPKIYPNNTIDAYAVIPERTRSAYQLPPGQTPEGFWVSETVRVWSSVKGILKHLAVLKYMQIVQKHKLFAMKFVDVKNKKGTALTLGTRRWIFVKPAVIGGVHRPP